MQLRRCRIRPRRRVRHPVPATATAAASWSSGAPCADATGCSSGFCVDGLCCDEPCGQGDDGDCRACDVSGSEGICRPLAAGSTCRSAADACDLAETCDGFGDACPVDQSAPDGTACGTTGYAASPETAWLPMPAAGGVGGETGEGGAGGSAGGTTLPPPGGDTHDAPEGESGCGCRLPRSPTTPTSWLVWLLPLGLFVRRRRVAHGRRSRRDPLLAAIVLTLTACGDSAPDGSIPPSAAATSTHGSSSTPAMAPRWVDGSWTIAHRPAG